ncbi:hypothetical protein [Pseudoalteromonas galatheae]|uniref:hypothetical protein n=1 Tax=Pseudoalteromonas galatheae TaxID=579562 RepID=UPI0030CEFBCA
MRFSLIFILIVSFQVRCAQTSIEADLEQIEKFKQINLEAMLAHLDHIEFYETTADYGLTTVAELCIDDTKKQLVGIPVGVFFYNNLYFTQYQMKELSGLNISGSDIKHWIKQSFDGSYDKYVSSDSLVTVRSAIHPKKLMSSTSKSFKGNCESYEKAQCPNCSGVSNYASH